MDDVIGAAESSAPWADVPDIEHGAATAKAEELWDHFVEATGAHYVSDLQMRKFVATAIYESHTQAFVIDDADVIKIKECYEESKMTTWREMIECHPSRGDLTAAKLIGRSLALAMKTRLAMEQEKQNSNTGGGGEKSGSGSSAEPKKAINLSKRLKDLKLGDLYVDYRPSQALIKATRVKIEQGQSFPWLATRVAPAFPQHLTWASQTGNQETLEESIREALNKYSNAADAQKAALLAGENAQSKKFIPSVQLIHVVVRKLIAIVVCSERDELDRACTDLIAGFVFTTTDLTARYGAKLCLEYVETAGKRLAQSGEEKKITADEVRKLLCKIDADIVACCLNAERTADAAKKEKEKKDRENAVNRPNPWKGRERGHKGSKYDGKHGDGKYGDGKHGDGKHGSGKYGDANGKSGYGGRWRGAEPTRKPPYGDKPTDKGAGKDAEKEQADKVKTS